MKHRKKLMWLGAFLLAAVGFVIYNHPQPLEKAVGEPFWTQSADCLVVEIGEFDLRTRLVLGETFPNVTVRGPYLEKKGAVNAVWIDLYAVCPEPDQEDAYARLELSVFREEITGKLAYSLNIGSQCYKVLSGEADIDAFIERMYEMAREEKAAG